MCCLAKGTRDTRWRAALGAGSSTGSRDCQNVNIDCIRSEVDSSGTLQAFGSCYTRSSDRNGSRRERSHSICSQAGRSGRLGFHSGSRYSVADILEGRSSSSPPAPRTLLFGSLELARETHMNWGSLGTRELLTQASGLWTSPIWDFAEGSRAKTNSCYRIVSMDLAPEEGTAMGGIRSCPYWKEDWTDFLLPKEGSSRLRSCRNLCCRDNHSGFHSSETAADLHNTECSQI